jgi:hypothetical protein
LTLDEKTTRLQRDGLKPVKPLEEYGTMATKKHLAGIRHRLFGLIVTNPAPGTVFNPRDYLADPGRFRDCMAWWKYKAARAGVGDGLPRDLREARLEQAAQDTLSVFLDRDYGKAKITADEPTRAVMGAAAYMRRAYYILPQVGDQPRRRDSRKWYPYNRALNAGTPNPSRIVAASFNATEDRAALMGEHDDAPGDTVAVAGGEGRPRTDGKMVPTMTILRQWVERRGEELEEMAEVETGWRMDRRFGKAQEYPACIVTDGKPQPRRRYTPAAPGPMVRGRDSGERSMLTTIHPNPEAYRAELAEYYAGK